MALGLLLISRSGTNEMLNLGGKFLMYIGFGTVVFGYLYAEFAGWEIFPHHAQPSRGPCKFCIPPSPMAPHVWHASLPLGIELAFPFHRVVMVEDHGNLEHLILLTIYLGVIHVFLGLAIGFRDILLYGNGHGGFGFVCAFFEKGCLDGSANWWVHVRLRIHWSRRSRRNEGLPERRSSFQLQ